MLFIHSTAKLAKAIDVKLDPSPVGGTPWIEHWYANLIALTEDHDAVLMTNAATLYSFVFPLPQDGIPFFAIIEYFRIKLVHAMTNQNLAPKQVGDIMARLDRYSVCKTASRSVLGSMNDLAFAMQFYADHTLADGSSFDLEKLEASLNETPMKPLGFRFPAECFQEKLR